MNAKQPAADTVLAVFAKAPVAGRVKTRLAATLGPEGAAILHRGLVEHTLEVLTPITGGRVELWCAPDTAHPFFAELQRRFGCALHAQTGGDLGARMAQAAASVLRRAAAVVLIGTDCPLLAAAQVETLCGALHAGADAVLLPAEDGGYFALGLRRFDPALFTDIDWGTEAVCAQTRARLDRLGWRWRQLDAVWDLDRPSDWARLQREAPAVAQRLMAETERRTFPPKQR